MKLRKLGFIAFVWVVQLAQLGLGITQKNLQIMSHKVAFNRNIKKKDVVYVLYSARDEAEMDSDTQPEPEKIIIKDEPEEFLLHCTLSTISIHKTEEDLLKEQEAWGACKKCNKNEQHPTPFVRFMGQKCYSTIRKSKGSLKRPAFFTKH